MATYLESDHDVTCFGRSDDNVWLKRLFGMACGDCGRNKGPQHTRGLLDIRIAQSADDHPKLAQCSIKEDSARFVWHAVNDCLEIESCWRLCRDTGIWTRRDVIVNTGAKAATILRCLARFPFSPGRYKIYSQDSRRCAENQGIWRELSHGSIVLGCDGGDTTQQGTPYVCLREVDSDTGVAFHIIPRGNWTIKVSARSACGESLPMIVVELGLADDHLEIDLQPGDRTELPEILAQPLPGGEPHLAAPSFHRHVLASHFADAKPEAPVVYNTWFRDKAFIDVEGLREELRIAGEIGCEVFTVDAGWYGVGPGDWYAHVGDWREKTDAAFRGRMSEFAEEVRAAGLGFGLWMEPERYGRSVPIVRAHPEWFLPGEDGYLYANLVDEKIYSYVLSEITRLIDTYQLAWIKLDFNFTLGIDPSGGEFSGYYEAWYHLMDELLRKYPRVFFEGCAGGGMRSDLATLAHCDGHFLSDTVNPIDTLRIYQGALLRLPPGRVIKWIALRSVARSGIAADTSGSPREYLITPCGPGWDRAEIADVDFAMRAVLPGMPGISGDLAGLPEPVLQRLAHHVDFFKKWRRFIAGSIAHMLTPPGLKNDRAGWAGIQLQSPDDAMSLVFVYRLDDDSNSKRLRLRGLEEACTYAVKNDDEPEQTPKTFSGGELMSIGLPIELATRSSAAVFSVLPSAKIDCRRTGSTQPQSARHES